MPPSYSPLVAHSDQDQASDPLSSADEQPTHVPTPFNPNARTQRTRQRPPMWLPDHFSQRPHTSEKGPFALGDDEGANGEEENSDSVSEASSVTAGRWSAEFVPYGVKEGEAESEDEEERLVRGEGEVVDPESGRKRGGSGRRGSLGELALGGKGGTARRRRLCFLLTSTLSALFLLTILLHSLFSPSTSLFGSSGYDQDGNEIHRHRFSGKGSKKISLEELQNGTWYSDRVQLDWVAAAGDGVFSQRASDGSILLTDVFANTSRTLVRGEDVLDPSTRERLDWQTFSLSPDVKFILFSTHRTKVWRHSSLSTFFLHRLDPPLTLPLLSPSSAHAYTETGDPTTSLAVFSPTDHSLAYVSNRNLFYLSSSSIDAAFSAADSNLRLGGGPGLSELERRRVRITQDGGEDTFNGVCDWVYEEEVFSSSSAVWFSPSSSHLAFLSFRSGSTREGEGEGDGTGAPAYDYPIYNSDLGGYLRPEGGADEYPTLRRLRYPKAGYPNPRVAVRVLRVEGLGESEEEGDEGEVGEEVRGRLRTLVLDRPFEEDNRLVTEVAFVGERDLVIKETTRDAAVERVGLFDLADAERAFGEGEDGERRLEGKVTREVDWVRRDGGWAEPSQNISPLSRSASLLSSSSTRPVPPPDFPAYLDIIPSPSGYNHLALFAPLDAAEPAVWLTKGEWEVDAERGLVGVDWARGFAYVLAARPSTSRHLLRVRLPRSKAELNEVVSGAKAMEEPEQLTGLEAGKGGKGKKEEELGAWGASFSPAGGVYLLSYEGPDIPTQTLLKVDEPDFSLPLTTNDRLRSLDPLYAHAQITHSTLTLQPDETSSRGEKVEVNVMEMRPPHMDESGKTKYPVLFQVYGGPSSQLVSPRFQRDWHHYLCTNLGYVIVRVDPRGTGFRGRKFRTLVRGRLGEVEARDVVEAGRIWSKKAYIDEKRVGIWGWSYGGFLTTKVIEANSSVFQLGMAVAPVTDWRYYDSIYTERYMSTPQLNAAGYHNSSIHEMDGFKHATYAVAHGTGDDNVHFQNTVNLLDRFTIAGVRDYHLRVYADSDHSISTRNAYWELMAWLESLLLEHFGVGGRTKQRWKLTAGEHTEKE
ncbi:hypothetical protein JCM11251_003456 [Rhodosporidiobolus azoricus]